MQSIKSGNNKSKQGIKSLLLMGTPVKSKLRLNKQLSEELIIACNFWWWFFHFKRALTSLQEHVKNFTCNVNTSVILSGQSLPFLQEVRVIKHMRKPAKPWGLARYNGNWLEFFWDHNQHLGRSIAQHCLKRKISFWKEECRQLMPQWANASLKHYEIWLICAKYSQVLRRVWKT